MWCMRLIISLRLSHIVSAGTDPSDSSATHRVRSKRCSCNNQLDSECHYFCHLDIIWVNTPSKTTVYGLGSPLARRRRSTGRCFCASPADRTCNVFCHYREFHLMSQSFS
uniref:Endothelin-like toxin domain-containing protein n=1 Tax=Sinocyclocheilus grahami TaxID=75366 RepID=A0A672K2Y0_SINGR